MEKSSKINAIILGLSIILAGLGGAFILGDAALQYKKLERIVTVKGLSERDVSADIVIWPIQFTAVDNSLSSLYQKVDTDTNRIKEFLNRHGIGEDELSISIPGITDKLAQQYNNQEARMRYTAQQTVTVYSQKVENVRKAMPLISELGKEGIVIAGHSYDSQVEYIYSGLNSIKPTMIEEGTKEARVVAEKFASDSSSKLGKIKEASQGQFSITPRDKNNPHIKKIRVVSTVQYYLTD